MANILLRYTNYFGRYSNNILINKCKKIINFKIERYNQAHALNTQKIFQNEEVEVNEFSKKLMNIRRCSIMNQSIDARQIESIIDTIPFNPALKRDEVSLLIGCCNKINNSLPLERVKMGQSLWMSLALSKDFKFSAYHYNLLLKLYIDNEYHFLFTDTIKEMRNKGINPTSFTTKLYIKHCCMKGDVSQGLMIVKDYVKKYLRTPISTFNILILGYSYSGNIKKVNDIVNIMKEKDIQLTSHSYFYIMCTYAKLNDIDKVREIIQDCMLKKIFFTNSNIINVIYILAKNKHFSNINKMYQYLYKQKKVWNDEMNVILKLIDIDQNQIAMNVLSHILLKSDLEFENALKIIYKYVIIKNKVISEVIIHPPLQNRKKYEKSVSRLLHYSLMYNNPLFLPLLTIYKVHNKIKPHYFWPLLVQHIHKYDIQGVLEILEMMTIEFNVSPCIYTIANYVFPLCFGETDDIIKILTRRKVKQRVINNAFVLWHIQKCHLRAAYTYMINFPDQYFYNIIINNLLKASSSGHDTFYFVRIGCNLVDYENSHTSMLNEKPNEPQFVFIDKLLTDFMINFPLRKIWLKKVVNELISYNELQDETVELIYELVDRHLVHNDVHNMNDCVSEQ